MEFCTEGEAAIATEGEAALAACVFHILYSCSCCLHITFLTPTATGTKIPPDLCLSPGGDFVSLGHLAISGNIFVILPEERM